MNVDEVLEKLQARGTAQNRKVYANHGMVGDVYGVSHANLGKLRRAIKVDQPLAEALWATGNVDARVLATMVADPSKMTAKLLDSWVKDADCRGIAAALSGLAARAPSAVKRMEKWTRSSNEWIGNAGWHTLCSLAKENEELSDQYLAQYVEVIESKIHGAVNWVRYSMNNALIAIGIRNARLRKLAVAAARRIGKVEVDHGKTGCKTPDAIPYIAKAVEHQRAMAARRKARAASRVR